MKRKEILVTCGVCLLPMLFGIIVYNQLPNQIPIHWNVSGEIDGYASKAVAVLLIPLLMVVLHLLLIFVMHTDPKFKNYSEKMCKLLIWIVPTITIVLEVITYSIVFGYNLSINKVLPAFVGLMFIVLGNYLPKCRQNFTVGYRLPWTLNNEDNWNKTNRLAGYLMVAGGMIIVIMSFLDLAFIPTLIVVAIITVIPMVYSFLLYRIHQ